LRKPPYEACSEQRRLAGTTFTSEGGVVRKFFEDFLDNPERYRACEAYWDELVQGIAQSLGQAGEWQRWMTLHYGGGMPFLDGNPMYDARSWKLDRALRILQDPAASDDVEILAYLETEREFLPLLPRHELVIALSLSQESAQLAESLLRVWMTPTTTVDEMESFVERVAPPGRG
jgi:hypothetical protein